MPSYPKHLAIIPDGNRRWAKKQQVPLIDAYKKGIKKIFDVISWTEKTNIQFLSFFCLSCENYQQRPKKEIHSLFSLLDKTLKQATQKKRNNIQFHFFGDLSIFSTTEQSKIKELAEKKTNTTLQVNIGLNYGGQQDILQAIKKLPQPTKQLSNLEFSQYLELANVPNCDALIRTGNVYRISNFLLWQIAYSELFFSPNFWAEFQQKEFHNILQEYSIRERRLGK